mgnify:CR=1 FL=1
MSVLQKNANFVFLRIMRREDDDSSKAVLLGFFEHLDDIVLAWGLGHLLRRINAG